MCDGLKSLTTYQAFVTIHIHDSYKIYPTLLKIYILCSRWNCGLTADRNLYAPRFFADSKSRLTNRADGDSLPGGGSTLSGHLARPAPVGPDSIPPFKRSARRGNFTPPTRPPLFHGM